MFLPDLHISIELIFKARNCIYFLYIHTWFRRSFFKRSLSDGNILRGSNTPSSCNVSRKKLPNSALSDRIHQVGDAKGLSDSTPDISTRESDVSYSRSATIDFEIYCTKKLLILT